jgi:adenylate cyclase
VSDEAVAFLHAHGISDEDIELATKSGRLHLLVLEQLALPGTPTYTSQEIAELSGMSLEDLTRFWRALGFPDAAPDERLFSEHDLDVLNSVTGSIAMGFTNLDVAVQMTRVYGSSMARIADAEVQTRSSIVDPEDSERIADLFALTGGGPLTGVATILEHVWRRHLQAALRRYTTGDADTDRTVAVGFCDLVGFTAMSQQMTEAELALVVNRFEELAYDTVAAGGGRVVKMIGDEVMFVVESPDVAAHIGLALRDAYSDEEQLSDVRVGIAHGPVLGREGDYYGPVVNLASRIVNIAFPGSVVVSAEVAEALEEDDSLELTALRPRVLKDIGRVPLFVVGRVGEERASWRGRARTSSPARDVVKAVLAEVARRHVERRSPDGSVGESAGSADDAGGGDGERAKPEPAVEGLDRPSS